MEKKYKRTKAYLKPQERVAKPKIPVLQAPPVQRRIFISHAATDKQIVDLFTNLLRLGCGITSGEIFYSSNPDRGVPPGQEMSLTIKGALRESAIGIAVITPNSNSSHFCISERGAFWAMDKKAIYLIADPVSYGDVKAPIGEQKILRLTNSRELDAMRDALADILKLPRLSTGDWSAARDEFLNSSDPLIQKFNTQRQLGTAAIVAGLPVALSQVVNLLNRHGANISVIVFDVDRMEQINKNHGFATGSILLHEISVMLDGVKSREPNALMAHRCGDDTFFLVVDGDEREAILLAQRILKSIQHIPIKMKRRDVFVSASAGVAIMTRYDTALSCLERAYFACSEGRKKGGNLVETSVGPQGLSWS